MPLGPFGPQFGFNSLVPNGSTHISTNISAVTGFQPPTGVVAYLFQVSDASPSTVRAVTGAVASTLVGHQYEAGRSDYVPYSSGQTLSLCPESGAGVTCQIQLTWYTST